MAFDLDQFVADCRVAKAEDPSHKAVREVVARAVSEPGEIMKALGEPTKSEVRPLYKGEDLSIIQVVWGPKMSVAPHNHNMWAVIGMYTGREDNLFWRRIKDDPEGRIEAAGASSLMQKDAHPLGADIIHSVANPLLRLTAAIHVYGGNFFDEPRSRWDDETLAEGDYDLEDTLKDFELGNKILSAIQ